MSKTKLTYKELADIFCTSPSQICNYIKRGKFNPNDIISIFDYYARTVFDIHDRRREQSSLNQARESIEAMKKAMNRRN